MTFDQAKEHLKSALADAGGLYCLSGCLSGDYLSWSPEDTYCILDGGFDADTLEAIAVFMRHQAQR